MCVSVPAKSFVVPMLLSKRMFVWGLGVVLCLWGGTGQGKGTASASQGVPVTGPDSVSHAAFDALLRQYVDTAGTVEYAALKENGASDLSSYLQQLAHANPASLDRDARLAFWINAYNAHTLKLVVDHYPISTIWAVTPGPPEPKEQSPFDVEVGTVADTTRTLNEIEHEIIRKRFDEPRIHFALVCAARSCPPLRRAAYTGRRLDEQLDDQARTFLQNRAKNRVPIEDDTISVSRLLKWYGADFGASPAAVQRALAPYFEGRVREKLSAGGYDVTYEPYDWALNDQDPLPEADRR